jgi:hypothetical protein
MREGGGTGLAGEDVRSADGGQVGWDGAVKREGDARGGELMGLGRRVVRDDAVGIGCARMRDWDGCAEWGCRVWWCASSRGVSRGLLGLSGNG